LGKILLTRESILNKNKHFKRRENKEDGLKKGVEVHINGNDLYIKICIFKIGAFKKQKK